MFYFPFLRGTMDNTRSSIVRRLQRPPKMTHRQAADELMFHPLELIQKADSKECRGKEPVKS